MKGFLSFIFLIILFPQILNDSLKETTNIIDIKIFGSDYNYNYNRPMGKKGGMQFGYFYLSELELDNKELEENTKFSLSIYNINNDNNYNIKCNFVNDYISSGEYTIFCIFGEDLPAGNYSVNFGNYNLEYNAYTFKISQEYGPIYVNKTDEYKLGLYQFNKQTIIINDKDIYELKFNIMDYNNEKLFIDCDFLYPLDHCKVENNEIKCDVTKLELGSIMKDSYESHKIYCSYNETNMKRIEFVRNIEIIYNVNKEDIYLTITKLLEGVGETQTYFAYETNVTEIQNIYTDCDFRLSFDKGNLRCGFRKYNNYPLLIVCNSYYEKNTYVLQEIKKEIIVEDINVKYNFRIQPVNNNEYINFSGKESDSIMLMYPNILDFKLKDSYSIHIIQKNYYLKGLSGFTFNEDSGDLNCIRKYPNDRLFVCNVNKNHFSGKKSGYYFIKHTNNLGNKSTNYEIAPIKILLDDGINPDENNEPGNKGNDSKSNTALYISLIVIGIIAALAIFFIVYKIIRKKSNDLSAKDEKNIGEIGLI